MKNLIQKFKEDPSGIIVFLLVGLMWGYMQLSAWQVFDNMYACSVKQAGWGWRVAGSLLTIASLMWGYGMATDNSKVTKQDTSNTIVLVLMTVLSLLSYMGFTTGYGCV